ncbi:hypothetical protein [Rhizobium leguminosarum]|uniref:hypothetical protein n=1 Tax=Rhizobium leguminosarum TaxID=384 RepID=UPI0004859A4B|nr:hypothetical protein [Rhizobium leguminosarum]
MPGTRATTLHWATEFGCWLAPGELGSLTLAECLAAVRDGRPMQTMAALIQKGHVEIDLDTELLGPDTVVRLASRRSA